MRSPPAPTFRRPTPQAPATTTSATPMAGAAGQAACRYSATPSANTAAVRTEFRRLTASTANAARGPATRPTMAYSPPA